MLVAIEEAIAGACGTAARSASDFALRTGPMVFHSACSCLTGRAAASHSVESASASACSQSASLRARFAAQSSLRRFRSSWRRVKKRSHAPRNRSQTAFSCPRLTGADGLPLGLQPLDLGGGLDPVGRVGQRLGAVAQRLLACEVRRALLVLRGQVRAVRANTSSCAVLNRRHIASPCARGASATCFHRALQLAHPAAGGLEVLFGLERLHLAAQLFLHLQVGPALPLVGVAQLLHARASVVAPPRAAPGCPADPSSTAAARARRAPPGCRAARDRRPSA